MGENLERSKLRPGAVGRLGFYSFWIAGVEAKETDTSAVDRFLAFLSGSIISSSSRCLAPHSGAQARRRE